MVCVVTSSEDFKNLQDKYKASSGIMENAIKVWYDTKGVEDYDPKDQNFIAHLNNYFKISSPTANLFSSQKTLKDAQTVWERDYKNLAETSLSENVATAVKNEAIKDFGKDAVIMYESNTSGQYLVRVAEPKLGTNSVGPLQSQSTGQDNSVKDYTNHSGGAIGADTVWDKIGKEFGMVNNKHYYFEGFKTPSGNTAIPVSLKNEADEKLNAANKTLGRKFPTSKEYVDNLLRRNWWQVKNSDAVFAISSITDNKVNGGTGWAVHMAIAENKPVYVFDQIQGKWFTWQNNAFIETSTPTLTKNFAGIGTRGINEQGKQAIRDVYTKTTSASSPKTEESVENTDKNIEAQGNSLYGANKALTAEERSFLGNYMMKQISHMLNELQRDPAKSQYYFGDKYPENFTTKSRTEIIETIGIQDFFNYIKETFYSPENRTDIEDFEALQKLSVAAENWQALQEVGYSMLISLEGLGLDYVTAKDLEDIKTLEFEDLHQQNETDENENKDRGPVKVEARHVSVKNSLSREIRRVFETLAVIDQDGNPVLDKYGFGFKTFVDAGIAVNSILEWVKDAESIEEMESILEERKGSNPWLNTILDTIKKEPLRSQFYQNFRKDFTMYATVVKRVNQDGSISFDTQIINTKEASKQMLDDIVSDFKIGAVKTLIQTLDIVQGKGQVNRVKVQTLKGEILGINKDLLDNFRTTESFKKAIDKNIPKIVSLLNDLGVRVDQKILKDALQGDHKKRNISTTNVQALLNQATHIADTLLNNVNRKDYNPMDKEETAGNVYQNYRRIVDILSPFVTSFIESSTYEGGKMYYSFVTPSYMGGLLRNLSDSLKNENKFKDYLQKEFRQYRFFKDGNVWKNEWLQLLDSTPNLRRELQHKVQLSFNKTVYKELSPAFYALSMLREYFYDQKNKKYAWYRVPILSDKPSSEFIKFKRYASTKYKEDIIHGLKNVFDQEIMRIKTVLEMAAKGDFKAIKNYNISEEDIALNQDVIDKLKEGKPPNLSDLVQNGQFRFKSRGMQFNFLPGLNQELLTGTPLGQMIISKINGDNRVLSQEEQALKEQGLKTEPIFESTLNQALEQSLYTYMDAQVAKEIAALEGLGLYETETYHVLSVDPETKKKENVEKTRFKYLNQVGNTKEEIDKAMEEYVWNDMFASINIIQLSVTDLAYYDGITDFQKRFAQVHSPGLRSNTSVVDNKGNKYSADGIERTIYLKDELIKSDIIENIRQVFQERMSQIPAGQKDEFKKMMDLILISFEKVNVTDAQGYSSPTSYRKKAGMAGRWDSTMEEAYDRITQGNFDLDDLGVLWQPLKPFVYSQIGKSTGASAMSRIKVPVQNKNSEHLLILADALMRGGNKPNKLTAIFEFMESSAYNGREVVRDGKVYRDNKFLRKAVEGEKEGTILNKGIYNGKGIDTVQFESAVKSGLQGSIDVNDLNSVGEIIERLERNTYYNENHSEDTANASDIYNNNFVHNIPFKDYAIQQEVPDHFRDEMSLMGTQNRILSISDVQDETLRPLIKEYQNLIADNIQESFDTLVEDLKLEDSDPVKQREAISKLLIDAMRKDQRYGADLIRAVSIENGDFVIPLSDPIHSVRIQQLINSIIKSRINKQKIAGGPLVQLSSFGLSEDLQIRWRDSKGKLLKTKVEFAKKVPEGTNVDAAYADYIKNNQHSVAYFEVYMPMPSEAMQQALTKPDGTLMTVEEAVKAGILNEEQLKSIGYRIPTEDKYSMFPMKIKGFMPRASGESIMLPREITLLSGSDFDIDKVYAIVKEFYKEEKINATILVADILKNKPEQVNRDTFKTQAYEVIAEMQQGKTDFEKGTLGDAIYNFYNNNKTKYTSVRFSEKKIKKDDQGNPLVMNKAGRNNRIFDIQWEVLTRPDTMSKMFNPGSFDTLKKSARIINIVKSNPSYFYEQLSQMSLDELKKVEGKGTEMSILHPSSQTYLFRQNMTAAKLIGIFANNNVSHGFISMQEMYLYPGDNEFTFDGREINSAKRAKIDPIADKNGNFLSKRIASFLAASVDAVKDPVLNYLNLNILTAGPSMVLARLGFDEDSIALLMTQPIIEKITDEYFRRNNEGYTSAEDIIDTVLEGLSVNADDLEQGLTQQPFTKKALAEELSKGLLDTTFQAQTALLLKRLLNLSRDLNNLTFVTKFNSSSNSPGPLVADTLVLEHRFEKFIKDMAEGGSFDAGEVLTMLENSPILKAFYSTTIGEQGASRLFFKQYFPHYNTAFTMVLQTLRDTVKAPLDSKIINKLVNDFVLYKLTTASEELVNGQVITKAPVFNTSKEERDRLIKKFPLKFKEKAQGVIDNDLINIIVTVPSNNRVPVPTLEAKTGGFTADMQGRIKDAWTTLIENPETRQVGIDLFFYNVLRSGFGFSPKSFTHLASSEVKAAVQGYIDAIRDTDYRDLEFNFTNFLHMFRRNHAKDPRLVPVLPETNKISINHRHANDTNYIHIPVTKTRAGIRNIIIKEDMEGIQYTPMIWYRDNLYEVYSNNRDEVVYKMVKGGVLGNPNNFLEYDGNVNSEDMVTSVDSYIFETEEAEAIPAKSQEGDGYSNQEKIADFNWVVNDILSPTDAVELKQIQQEGNKEMVKQKYAELVQQELSHQTDKEVRNRLEKILEKIC